MNKLITISLKGLIMCNDMFYVIYRDDRVYKCYLDIELAHDRFSYYCDKDEVDEYTWSITSYRIERG